MATKKDEVTPIRNLTVSSMGAKPKTCINSGNAVFCGRMFGIVSAVKHQESKQGKIQAVFIGDFQGVGPDGARFSSTRMYLPGQISENLDAQFGAGDSKALEFAYDLVASEAEKSPVGYAYSLKHLIKTKESDKLAEMSTAMDQVALPTLPEKKGKDK